VQLILGGLSQSTKWVRYRQSDRDSFGKIVVANAPPIVILAVMDRLHSVRFRIKLRLIFTEEK